MQLKIHQINLQLANPFTTTHGTRTIQPTLITEITNEDGQTGYGEAPMTSYYGLNSEDCAASLLNFAPALAPKRSLTPAEMHALIDSHAPGLNTFLRCALDVATHDLWAKTQGRRLGEIWTDLPATTPTCYTIGLAGIDEMVAKLRATPWPIYKIKLGAKDDLAVIRALRAETDAPFYVDANTGWTAQQTIDNSRELKALGVVFIEQPLPVDDTEGQARVKAESALPIIADESCQTYEDVDTCAELFHGINIKVVKCGGLLPARRMVARARVLGLEVMAGCMTESSVGISGIAQLLPELDYADLDGAMLLKNGPASGVTFDPATGRVVYPGRAGTGAVLHG